MRPASRLAILVIAALALGACTEGGGLRDLRDPSAGPEEFSIIPGKTLETPQSFSALPPPTPGQASRADINPNADAIVALGGNPARLGDTSVPGSDSALVASASRYGVPGNIRQTTAAEDAEFRKRRGRFTSIRLFKTDRYAQVYSRESLDPRTTLNTFRRAGRKTPTAPPAN